MLAFVLPFSYQLVYSPSLPCNNQSRTQLFRHCNEREAEAESEKRKPSDSHHDSVSGADLEEMVTDFRNNEVLLRGRGGGGKSAAHSPGNLF